ncbi:cardiolipin synthase [Priestia flexa]|uniref:cardiolipin synthase n=1 Tax=Priestia TaxID=2800373 RepID=UPI00288CB60C|nr:cardiolipin synthase [Priestia flexa]MDT2044839.1 cardiolipin synthase [Priestia flexa]
MLATIIILIVILIVAWFAIDLGVGKKELMQEERTFPMRQASLKLFTDGTKLYNDLFKSIEQAQHSIHISFYIVKNDQVSQQFVDLLCEKANQQVDVRLLVDRIGSMKLNRKMRNHLQSCGVKFSFSRRIKFPYLFYTINARNHRKITIIDESVGYIGGFNIGQEYLGLDPKLGIWKDYHLKITGEAVTDLQTQFLTDWGSSVNNEEHEEAGISKQIKDPSMQTVQLRSTEGVSLEDHFLHIINEAKDELCIGTPYFIPTEALMTAILEARKRGVMVYILIPMRADHPLVRDAAFSYLPTLVEAGCQVHQFYYGFYHGKVMIADERICDVGTANFDKRSLFLNGEINCFIFDPAFIKHVKETFHMCLHDCPLLSLSDIKKRNWFDRFKQGVATFISPLL